MDQNPFYQKGFFVVSKRVLDHCLIFITLKNRFLRIGARKEIAMDVTFPRTYVDLSEDRLKASIAESSRIFGTLESEKNTGGTTIVALLSKDKKIGVIAADGRVSIQGGYSLQEDFGKIFDCRIGFIGGAGELGAIQIVIPAFQLSLTSICDSRDEFIPASGASRGLFHYYRSVGDRVALVALFWDFDDKTCHLYQLEGMSYLKPRFGVTIGHGAALIMGDVKKFQGGDSREELVETAGELIVKAAQIDKATNDTLSFGIIENGKFEESEGGLL